jgi:hypothetical protein
MNLDFNKIFVIQSLDVSSGDELTGQQLFDEVLQHFHTIHPDKSAVIINVDTKLELIKKLEDIKIECERDGIKPIIHFEIHGLENRSGLGLNKDDIYWNDLYQSLIEINIASKWNLFVTMAVCYGNYAMVLIKPRHPAPYAGILGSFDDLFEWDLYIRFNAFYQELLYSLDFEKALEALHNSNPGLPADYRFISSEQTFKNVYQRYFDEKFSPGAIKERFDQTIKEEGIGFKDRTVKEQFYNKFKVELLRSKKEFFETDKATFFMFDRFPGHKYIYCADWEPNYH